MAGAEKQTVIAVVVLCVILLVLVRLLFYILRQRRNHAEMRRLQRAGLYLLKNEQLQSVIAGGGAGWVQNRPLLALFWKDKTKRNYVFDPVKGITIGRDTDNTICITDGRVTSHHCRIYLSEAGVVLEDLHSSNGTILKRGLRKYAVSGPVYLEDGDVICVSIMRFRVRIFRLESGQM